MAVLVQSCEDVETKREADACFAERAEEQAKIAELEDRLATFGAEVLRLKDTAQAQYQLGVAALKARQLDEAQNAFQRVVDRFPADPLVAESRKRLIEVVDVKLSTYVQSLERGVLTVTNKETFESARDQLTRLISECAGCLSRGAAQQKLNDIERTIGDWPIEIEKCATLAARYPDLVGKRLSMKQMRLSSNDVMFIGKYRSRSTWRTYKMICNPSYYLYCRRGDGACERIFDRALRDGVVEITNLQMRYALSNRGRTFAPDQLELLSWELPE